MAIHFKRGVVTLDLNGFDTEGYRWRIRVLRKLSGNMSQTDFARHIGIAYKKWHHYESGYPIPRETAFLLRKRCPGFPTDWIWFGDPAGLSSLMVERIQQAERELRAADKVKIKSRARPTLAISAVRRRVSKMDKSR